jgi:hypothetical protein
MRRRGVIAGSMQEDVFSHGARCGDADHEAGSRHDSVVRAKHRGSKPTNPASSVPFTMPKDRSHARFLRGTVIIGR